MTDTRQAELENELIRAAEENNAEKVKTLIEQGVPADVQTSRGVNILDSLMSTADNAKRHEEVINLLIGNGADISSTDVNGETLLFRAVEASMITTAKKLIERGIDVTVRGGFNFSPLFYAEDVEMMKLLVEHEVARPDERDALGRTVLHNAVGDSAKPEIVKYLVGIIDVNALDEDGVPPLHVALRNDRDLETAARVVDILIENGADPNLSNDNGYTPAIVATRNRRLSVGRLKALIEAGADIHKSDNKGALPVHHAVARHFEHLKFFVDSGVDINIATKKENLTLLHVAVLNNLEETAAYLLERGAEPSIRSSNGKTPLNYALERDYADMAELLKQHGGVATDAETLEQIQAAEATQDDTAATGAADPLKTAIKAGEVRSVEEQLAHIDKAEGYIDLHDLALYTLQRGNLDIFKLLVDRGLDLGLTDEGFNMLHDAVYFDKPDIVEYLIECGLDIHSKTENGRNVFSLSANSSPAMFEKLERLGMKGGDGLSDKIVSQALYEQNPAMAGYLIERGYPFDLAILDRKNFLFELVRRQDTDTYQFLFDKGLDVDTTVSLYGDEVTLLHMAVTIKARRMVDFLLSAGADPDRRDSSGEPIWLAAVRNGRADFFKALFDHGANPDASYGRFNKTALHVALEAGDAELARLAIEAGANVNQVEDSQKRSPMHLAAKQGFLDTLKQLVAHGGNVHQLDKGRKAPLDLAVEFDQKAASEYLRKQEDVQPGAR